MKKIKTIVDRVASLTVLVNVFLSIFKLIAGLLSHSNALISDAIHSASDIFSTVVVLIGVRLSVKESDRDHPYGHERLECVAAIILSMILFVTGCGIGLSAVKSIFSGDVQSEIPGMFALLAALVSIAVKEGMYWYTRYYAKKIDSAALMADAWHHRSDALSSVGALIGVGGARLGFPIMDSIASLVIFLFICKAAFDIFIDAMNKIVDHSCDESIERELIQCALEVPEVMGIDLLRTRIFGNRVYVDMEIVVHSSMNVEDAHNVADAVHDRIEKHFSCVKHILIHVNPHTKTRGGNVIEKTKK